MPCRLKEGIPYDNWAQLARKVAPPNGMAITVASAELGVNLFGDELHALGAGVAAAHITVVVMLGHVGLAALVAQSRRAVAAQVVETVHPEQVDGLGTVVAGYFENRLLDALAQVVAYDAHYLALGITLLDLAEKLDIGLAESAVGHGVDGAARLCGIGGGVDGSHDGRA